MTTVPMNSQPMVGGYSVSQHGLSPREVQIVQLLCAGGTTKGIARTIGITFRTVQKHRERITKKTAARGVQLGVWAVRHRVVA